MDSRGNSQEPQNYGGTMMRSSAGSSTDGGGMMMRSTQASSSDIRNTPGSSSDAGGMMMRAPPSPTSDNRQLALVQTPRQRSSSNPPRQGGPPGMGLPSPLGRAPGSGRPNFSTGLEAKRFDAIEHRLSTLEEKEKQTAMDLARSTGFLRNELASLKQMGDQRWDALHAQHKAIEMQLARARESTMSYVREEMNAQREQKQEWLLRIETTQRSILQRLESLDGIKAPQDEGLSRQLREMTGKLQDSFSMLMSSPAGGTNTSFGRESSSVGWQTQNARSEPMMPLDSYAYHQDGQRVDMKDSMTSASRAITGSLSEQVLARALETAAEAGANSAMEQLHDLTKAQNLCLAKQKDHDRRLEALESSAGVLGTDSSSARRLGIKFCC